MTCRKSPRSRSTKANSGHPAVDHKIKSLGVRSKASKKGKKSCHQEQKTNKGPWDNLPVHLLSCVIPHLSYLEDYMALSSTCKPWRKFIVSEKKPPLPLRSPVLMLVKKVGYDRESGKYQENLATMDLKKKLNISLCKLKLPGPSFRRCMGVHFGLVLTVDMDLQINLLHPFSGDNKFQLPPNPSIQELTDPEDPFLGARLFDIYTDPLIQKAALSSNPENTECVVMGIFSGLRILAIARPHDKSWTKIETSFVLFDDVTYYNEKFYAVDADGVLFVCDIDGAGPSVRKLTLSRRWTVKGHGKYLVESAGDLFLVVTSLNFTARGLNRARVQPTYNANELYVFKLVRITNEERVVDWSWGRIYDLGNAAFLVGASTSVSLTASETNGLYYKPNHIYITDSALASFDYYLTVIDMEHTTVKCYELNKLYKALPVAPFFYK